MVRDGLSFEFKLTDENGLKKVVADYKAPKKGILIISIFSFVGLLSCFMFIESNIVFLIAAILIPIVYFFGIFPRRIEILKKQDELVIKKINSFFSKEEKKLLCNSDTKLVGGQTGVKGYYFPILIYKDGNSNKKIRLHHGIFSFPSGDVVGDLTRFVKKEEIERIAKFLDLRLKLE